MPRPVVLAALAGTVLALAGCNQTSAPRETPVAAGTANSSITPSTFRMPEGTGCAADIARFKAVADNDYNTGFSTDGVHAKVTADLAKAADACNAGQGAQASAMVRAARARYGYPAG